MTEYEMVQKVLDEGGWTVDGTPRPEFSTLYNKDGEPVAYLLNPNAGWVPFDPFPVVEWLGEKRDGD